MVARGTPKPSQKDTLKRIVSEIRNNNTVGHGIKYAGEGEGTLYRTSDTSMLLWDGPTAMSWRNDMDYAALEIEKSKATLEKTAQDLADAGARIDETNAKLGEADARSTDAAELAASVSRELDTVEGTLETTARDLTELTSKFSSVETVANSADTRAGSALSAAQAAQQTADTTASNFTALDAKLTAALAAKPGMISDSSFELPEMWDAAYGAIVAPSPLARSGSNVLTLPWDNTNNSNAAKAVHTYSREALDVVQGNKYRMTAYLRGTADPTAMGNFILRTAERVYLTNTTLTSLGDSGVNADTWVMFQADWEATQTMAINVGFQARNLTADLLVDDLQMVDATAEASLRLAVEDAKREAEDAAKAAQAANTAAGLAQKAADGKTTITTNTAAPSGLGVSVGDIHVRMTSMSASGQIIGQWRWDGSDWVAQKIGSDFIAEMNVGKLTGTFANFTQHLSAGAITTPYLTVGIGPNVVPNGGGQAWGGWENFGHNTSGPEQNNGYPGSFWILGTSTKTSARFPLTPGEWGFTASAKGQHDNGRAYVQINCYGIDGERITGTYPVSNQVIPNGTWKDFSAKVTIPAGVVEADIRVYANHINGIQAEDYQWFTGFSLKEYVSGELLINGTVTGDKVDAESVAAKVGQFVKVQAVNVEVTEDLATRVVNSMTANTKNLVVTGSAVIQHATLLGTTVADELNVRRLISGRDAILTGTVDIAQLNVTGTMAAEIANAMTVNTKKLVVTESAVMQHLTALEGIVTSELISQKASVEDLAAKMLTGGHIQTDPALNRGVKMDNSGIRAWNSAGTQTVRLNGSDNLLQGTFQTGTTGARAKIASNADAAFIAVHGPRSDTDHGSIVYHAPDNNALNAYFDVMGIIDYSGNRNNPALRLFPGRGTFAFQGRWAQDTDAVKFVLLSNFTGLRAGEYARITVPYSSPFPTNNSRRWPVVSVETRNGADVIATIVAQTAEDITVNVVNKSPSTSTGVLYVRIATFNVGQF